MSKSITLDTVNLNDFDHRLKFYIDSPADSKITGWIPCFRAGEYPQGRFEQKHIEKIVANYDKDYCPAPITLDHHDEGEAFGWVHSVKVDGNMIYCRFEKLDPDFVRKVNEGRYPNRSVELFWTEERGLYLRAVTFLGAQTPQVKGMGFAKFSNVDFIMQFEEAEAEKPEEVIDFASKLSKIRNFQWVRNDKEIGKLISYYEDLLDSVDKDKDAFKKQTDKGLDFLEEVKKKFNDVVKELKELEKEFSKAESDTDRQSVIDKAKDLHNKHAYSEEYMEVLFDRFFMSDKSTKKETNLRRFDNMSSLKFGVSVIDKYIKQFKESLKTIQNEKKWLDASLKQALDFLDEVAHNIGNKGIAVLEDFKKKWDNASDGKAKQKIEQDAKSEIDSQFGRYYHEWLDVVYSDIYGFSHKPVRSKPISKFGGSSYIDKQIETFKGYLKTIEEDKRRLIGTTKEAHRFLDEVYDEIKNEGIERMKGLKAEFDKTSDQKQRGAIEQQAKDYFKSNWSYYEDYIDVIREEIFSSEETSVSFADFRSKNSGFVGFEEEKKEDSKADEKENDELKKLQETLSVIDDQIKEAESKGDAEEVEKLKKQREDVKKRIEKLSSSGNMSSEENRVLMLERQVAMMKTSEQFSEVGQFLDMKARQGKILPFEHKAAYRFSDGSLMNLKTFINGLDERRKKFFMEFLEKRDVSLFKSLEKGTASEIQDLDSNPYGRKDFANERERINQEVLKYCHQNGLDPTKDYNKALDFVMKMEVK